MLQKAVRPVAGPLFKSMSLLRGDKPRNPLAYDKRFGITQERVSTLFLPSVIFFAKAKQIDGIAGVPRAHVSPRAYVDRRRRASKGPHARVHAYNL